MPTRTVGFIQSTNIYNMSARKRQYISSMKVINVKEIKVFIIDYIESVRENV
jgi:hypothetical protein